MSELAMQIYEALKTNAQYTYSTDVNIKVLEIDAIKELEFNNYIVIKARSIGYVIANVL